MSRNCFVRARPTLIKESIVKTILWQRDALLMGLKWEREFNLWRDVVV
jgi:hypothetical protein